MTSESEWISVKKKLPKNGESVLVYLSFKKVGTCMDVGCVWKRRGKNRWAILMDSAKQYDPDFCKVTHWMPLPEKPEVK